MSLAARPAKVYAAVFLDNQSLATGGSDNRIHIWDLDSRIVTKELVGHTGSVAALACDRTGTMLVSGSYDTTLRVWDLQRSTAVAPVAARRAVRHGSDPVGLRMRMATRVRNPECMEAARGNTHFARQPLFWHDDGPTQRCRRRIRRTQLRRAASRPPLPDRSARAAAVDGGRRRAAGAAWARSTSKKRPATTASRT